ncbi:MAG: hypothetical protein HQ596_04745 [Candidatus Saganbacteria bacterium]|nr:hypothetical protein [Candidatus Saganbacteria bacterium]
MRKETVLIIAGLVFSAILLCGFGEPIVEPIKIAPSYKSTVNDIRISAKSVKPEYGLSDLVSVEVTFTNRGDDDQYLCLRSADYLSVKILNQNNQKCEKYPMVVYSERPIGEQDFHLIPVGKSYVVTFLGEIKNGGKQYKDLAGKTFCKSGDLILENGGGAYVLGKPGRFYVTIAYSADWENLAKELGVKNVFSGALEADTVSFVVTR